MQVGLMFEFANPPQWRRDPVELYRSTLEQAAWCETAGFDSVWLPEHHFTHGYPSAPLTLLAAIAAVTTRVRLGTGILIAPIQHPVKLAEEVATLDILSGGRIELGLGLGYRRREYASFAADPARRLSLMRELIEDLRSAWTTEQFFHESARGSCDGVNVLPKPVQKPHPPLWGGATTAKGARRIGRLGLHFQWTWNDRNDVLAYLEGWQEMGRAVEDARVEGYLNMLVCDDPERTWQVVRPHFVYQQSRRSEDDVIGPGGTYFRYEPATVESIEAAREAGSGVDGVAALLVVTPEQAIAEIARRSEGLPVNGFYSFNSVCGMPDDVSQRHVELLANVVAPAVKPLGVAAATGAAAT